MDALYLSITVLFFVATWALVLLFERLRRPS